jgi:hypothetical protein
MGLEALDGFNDLSTEEKASLKSASDQALETVKSSSLFAVIRDTVNRYKTQGYEGQLAQLNGYIQSKAEAKGVKEASQYVSCGLIAVDFKKPIIETIEDLDAYLEAVKKAYSQELKSNRKITLR